MRKKLLLASTLLLVACSQTEISTKEYSCAPQNIQFDEASNRLACDSPKDSSAMSIYCLKGTYREENGSIKSCTDSQKVRHVVKPILLSDSEAFAKKQECNKLLPQINKILKDKNDTLGTFSILDKVFYSVSMNSCLYHYNEFNDGKNEILEQWMLRDGFTNEQLNFGMAIRGNSNYREEYDDFQKKLTRYE